MPSRRMFGTPLNDARANRVEANAQTPADKMLLEASGKNQERRDMRERQALLILNDKVQTNRPLGLPADPSPGGSSVKVKEPKLTDGAWSKRIVKTLAYLKKHKIHRGAR